MGGREWWRTCLPLGRMSSHHWAAPSDTSVCDWHTPQVFLVYCWETVDPTLFPRSCFPYSVICPCKSTAFIWQSRGRVDESLNYVITLTKKGQHRHVQLWVSKSPYSTFIEKTPISCFLSTSSETLVYEVTVHPPAQTAQGSSADVAATAVKDWNSTTQSHWLCIYI